MAGLIVFMIVLDFVHPPAVSTALSFALRAGAESNLAIFGFAVGVTAVLILLERAMLWLLAHHGPASDPSAGDQPEEG